jgi:chromate reductase, NAD(P)H dehydrogenase (quinone)
MMMPNAPLTILGVAGSLRRGSYNRGLIRAAMRLAPPGVIIVPHDIGDLPLYNADLEADGDPEPVGRWKRAIEGADALLVATPEYNRCVPGVLKNAIDWASRPVRASVLRDRPVGIMGATPGRGGTARAQAHLRDGFAFTGGIVLPVPEVLVPLADAKFDAAGDLIDEETTENVRDLVRALAAWTQRVRTRAEDEAAAS